jgi:hypothetical protein
MLVWRLGMSMADVAVVAADAAADADADEHGVETSPSLRVVAVVAVAVTCRTLTRPERTAAAIDHLGPLPLSFKRPYAASENIPPRHLSQRVWHQHQNRHAAQLGGFSPRRAFVRSPLLRARPPLTAIAHSPQHIAYSL